MLNIGCHLSTSKGFKNMGKEALSIGANTFQFFTRNPRGGKAKDIDAKDVNELLEIMEKYIKNDDSVIMPTVGLSMLNYCIENDIIPKCKISAIEISKIIDIMIMKVPDKKDKELIIKMLDIGEEISSEYWRK